MQWKSLLFFIAVAESALARSHGHLHRRHEHRHAEQLMEQEMKRAVDTNFFFDQSPIIITTTVWDCCSTTSLTTSSSTAAPEPIEPLSETPVDSSSSAPAEEITSTPAAVVAAVAVTTPSTSITTTTTSTIPPEPTTTSAAPTTTTTPIATTTSAAPAADWTSVPTNGEFCTTGFGGRTSSSNTRIMYAGNTGNPWGSNIIEVAATEASLYKYVVQFTGSNTDTWTVVVWNKIGPTGLMDGWYGNEAVKFTLAPGETRYVAFDENSQGSWGAAPGDSLPTDINGGYSCTWGEFDFGNEENGGWSGWDVSAIQAQAAGHTVQGMKICSHNGEDCSVITTGAAIVTNAYLLVDAAIDGIGGKVVPGPVRVACHVDYSG